MRVQRFEGLPINNQVFKSHSTGEINIKRIPFEMDSVDSALETDSLESPIIPQIARKFKKAFNIVFPPKVIEEAQTLHDKINGNGKKNTINFVA